MQRKIPSVALDNHPFFAQIYKDLTQLEHSFQGKAWPVEEFLYNLYELLRNYIVDGLPDKLEFYDAYLYNKFKNRRDGHQYTIEFLVSWVKFYQDSLEVRLVHQLAHSAEFSDAVKFLIRARKVAMTINGLDPGGPWSSDKIFLDRKGIANFCDELFGPGSDSDKVWKWLQQENRHFHDIQHTAQDLDGVQLLSGHIDSERVSLSYLLEYVLKDFLPDKKRYINKLYDLEKTSAGPVTGGPYSPSKARPDGLVDDGTDPVDMPLLDPYSTRTGTGPMGRGHPSGSDDYMLYGTNPKEASNKNCMKCDNDQKYFSTPN
jgi:hypothetical protein